MTQWSARRVHFIGIGGAGMSGLALVATALGAEVSGSDRAESPYFERLRAIGIDARVGHDAANLPERADVVVSTAIPESNPELAHARELGLRVLHRGEMLAEVAGLKRSIAVAGAHGKTTTTAMLAHLLRASGRDPAFVIGGELRAAATNAAWGDGDWIVIEADESDRSFLRLAPDVAVVTNIELDHHTTYASEAELIAAFDEFAAKAGEVIAWENAPLAADARRFGIAAVDTHPRIGSEPNAAVIDADLRIGSEPNAAVIDADLRIGSEPNVGAGRSESIARVASITAEDVELVPGGSRFRVGAVGVELRVPGAHNVLNALAALAAADVAGVPLAEAAAALAGFSGTGRRFEPRGATASGARVVDDYAHHPTEVRATLEAARTLGAERVVAVFQPHLYSRTQELARQFGEALALADVAVVVDVYPARERAEDYPGVTGYRVAAATAKAARGRPVWWIPSMDDAAALLEPELRDGDVVLTLGAGNIDSLAERLTK